MRELLAMHSNFAKHSTEATQPSLQCAFANRSTLQTVYTVRWGIFYTILLSVYFFLLSRLPLLLLLDACAYFVWFVMSVRFGGAWIREIHADITTEPYSLHWIPNCIRLLQTHPLAYIPFNERTEISVWQIYMLYTYMYRDVDGYGYDSVCAVLDRSISCICRRMFGLFIWCSHKFLSALSW